MTSFIKPITILLSHIRVKPLLNNINLGTPRRITKPTNNMLTKITLTKHIKNIHNSKGNITDMGLIKLIIITAKQNMNNTMSKRTKKVLSKKGMIMNSYAKWDNNGKSSFTSSLDKMKRHNKNQKNKEQ